MTVGIELLVKWLVTAPPYDLNLPEDMSNADFLEAWIQIGDAPSQYLGPLTPDEVDSFIQHASDCLQFMIWWAPTEGGMEIDSALKIAAINASPEILRDASRATSGHCMGCLMFWEQISGVRRRIEGDQLIWQAIGNTIRGQLESSSDECTTRSAEHGLEHYRQTEAEGW